ncbi:MAG: hypothetical protein AB9856_01390 [Cellulosilyticaceae bacterium]
MGFISISPGAKEWLKGDKTKQSIIVKSNNFSLKLGGKGDTHVVRVSCKIVYPDKYKRKVDKCVKSYGEDMNALIGNYFRQIEFSQLSEEDFFEVTKNELRGEINNFINQKIPDSKGQVRDYISEVILFDVLYQ